MNPGEGKLDLPFSLEDLRAFLAEQSGAGGAPLSSAQRRLWFLDQLEPGSPRYNIPSVLWLEGELNVGALEAALQMIVGRHETLRVRFVSQDGEPAQVIASPDEFKVERQDLSGLPAGQRERVAEKLIEQEVRRPFDLHQDLPLRVTLLRVQPAEHVLIVNMHHIVSDEWSFRLFFRELQAAYTAFVRGEPPKLPELLIQYSDYAAWQGDWMESDEFDRQLQFWKEQLAGNPAGLELPVDRPRVARPNPRGALQISHLPPEAREAVAQLAARHCVTPFMVLLAGFKALLYGCTGQDDVIVGSPMACRNQIETENVIGFFANTLPLRTAVSGDLTFEQLLRRVRDVVLGACCNQEIAFEKVVEALQPPRIAGRTPYINVLFLFQSEAEFPELPGLRLTFLDLGTDTAKFDVTLFIAETDEGLVLAVEYNSEIFNAETIAGLVGSYQRLMRAVVAAPEQRLSDLPMTGLQSEKPEAWAPPRSARWQFVDRWFELRRERSGTSTSAAAAAGGSHGCDG